jgi:catechol 2,3-dioxygenase-like lactoylglutathione lyase family enzyme
MEAVLHPGVCVFVVPTDDLRSSLRFYRDGLGLELVEEWNELGQGALFRLSERTELELIELDGVLRPPEPCTGIGLEVREDEVDAVYERLLGLGHTVKGPPRLRAWGKRGFGAIDPSGTPVNIYGPRHAPPYDDEGAE